MRDSSPTWRRKKQISYVVGNNGDTLSVKKGSCNGVGIVVLLISNHQNISFVAFKVFTELWECIINGRIVALAFSVLNKTLSVKSVFACNKDRNWSEYISSKHSHISTTPMIWFKAKFLVRTEKRCYDCKTHKCSKPWFL